jgi:hypothetical protein
MNSRERIFKALNHEEPDRIPYDLAGTTWTGITNKAYQNLRKYLDLAPVEPQWSDVIQQIVIPDEEFLDRFNVDVRGIFPLTSHNWNVWSKVRDRNEYLEYRDEWGFVHHFPKNGHWFSLVESPMENINFDDRKITILGKGNKRRSLHLDHEMIAILTQWIAVRKQFLNHDISNALFISKKGNRLATRTMEHNFKKIIKKLNLTVHFNITCHSLRHAFASHLNDENVDVLVIQDLLGHATPKTTADYYIHPSEQKVREALEKLPGIIYMNQLLKDGFLKFQSNYHQRE